MIETKRSVSGCEEDRAPIVLVGNKSDLPGKREVQLTEGQAQAREWNCGFFETSAKLDENIQDAFIDLIREMNVARKPILKPPTKKSSCPCTLL